MKNPIKFIFTVMYRWANNLNLDSSPEWSAFVGVSVMVIVNLLTFYSYLVYHYILTKGQFSNKLDYRISFVIGVLVFGLIYFTFIHKDKYKAIRKDELFKNGRIWQSLIVWIYILSSFYLMSIFKNPNGIYR